MKLAVIAALASVGCDSPGDETPDAPPTIDSSDSGDSGTNCTQPDLSPSWLRPLLQDAVAHLAASPRFLPSQRENARLYLSAQLESYGWTAARHQYSSGANVYATIPATTGTGKTIIVGAHFDTVDNSPGANDNASGTAVVLAVARFLADVPCRNSPVTIVFFDQEELGLFGSRRYAQQLPPDSVSAVHTIDQVAWDEDGDGRFELELPTPTLRTAWENAASSLAIPLTVVPTEGTDHEAFRELGIPAVGLTEEYVGGDTSPFRHTPQDTVASIAPYRDYMENATRLTARVIIDRVSE